jgi:ABC-type transporter Mla maintaining outer membrane lipid asymmetry ATPase subunit MlaF
MEEKEANYKQITFSIQDCAVYAHVTLQLIKGEELIKVMVGSGEVTSSILVKHWELKQICQRIVEIINKFECE